MSADAPLVALSAVGRTQNERRDDAVRRRDELSHYVIKLFRLTRLDASAPPARAALSAQHAPTQSRRMRQTCARCRCPGVSIPVTSSFINLTHAQHAERDVTDCRRTDARAQVEETSMGLYNDMRKEKVFNIQIRKKNKQTGTKAKHCKKYSVLFPNNPTKYSVLRKRLRDSQTSCQPAQHCDGKN